MFDLETLSLDATKGEIVSISFVKEKRGAGDTRKQVLLNHDDDEKGVIQVFVEEIDNLDSGSKLVTYNGDNFDWPFIIARAQKYDFDRRFEQDETIVERLFRLWRDHGFDLMKEHGTYPDGRPMSLEDCLNANGFSHDEDCDGSMVPQLFENGEWGRLRDYSLEDSVKTYKLFKKLEDNADQNGDEK